MVKVTHFAKSGNALIFSYVHPKLKETQFGRDPVYEFNDHIITFKLDGI